MNALVVDTSSWISYLSGKANEVLDTALKEGRVWLPPLVAAELLSAKLATEERRSLREMLEELPLCACALDHWAQVGELRALCAEKGVKISTPDAHIAQCSLDLNGYLMSEDKVFEKLTKHSGLRLI